MADERHAGFALSALTLSASVWVSASLLCQCTTISYCDCMFLSYWCTSTGTTGTTGNVEWYDMIWYIYIYTIYIYNIYIQYIYILQYMVYTYSILVTSVDLSLASPRITSVGLVRPSPGEAQLYGTSRGEGRVKSKFDRGCRCDTVIYCWWKKSQTTTWDG